MAARTDDDLKRMLDGIVVGASLEQLIALGTVIDAEIARRQVDPKRKRSCTAGDLDPKCREFDDHGKKGPFLHKTMPGPLTAEMLHRFGDGELWLVTEGETLSFSFKGVPMIAEDIGELPDIALIRVDPAFGDSTSTITPFELHRIPDCCTGMWFRDALSVVTSDDVEDMGELPLQASERSAIAIQQLVQAGGAMVCKVFGPPEQVPWWWRKNQGGSLPSLTKDFFALVHQIGTLTRHANLVMAVDKESLRKAQLSTEKMFERFTGPAGVTVIEETDDGVVFAAPTRKWLELATEQQRGGAAGGGGI